ncbi:hypothetical protein CERZMDRAFT_100644 [Cercospora zeae-maydis SCOH1-5]|uniref:Uncharacterized protein n=1 Tax=Cercospora zeae-maydis SCOH1-5 TaxID=717836 RepID=A0A6A6F5C7_9PEZI|nr:hypothetical protein CERZMDRAFT_100644 [Cercospora zeae-maydis SCOH1-5]
MAPNNDIHLCEVAVTCVEQANAVQSCFQDLYNCIEPLTAKCKGSVPTSYHATAAQRPCSNVPNGTTTEHPQSHDLGLIEESARNRNSSAVTDQSRVTQRTSSGNTTPEPSPEPRQQSAALYLLNEEVGTQSSTTSRPPTASAHTQSSPTSRPETASAHTQSSPTSRPETASAHGGASTPIRLPDSVCLSSPDPLAFSRLELCNGVGTLDPNVNVVAGQKRKAAQRLNRGKRQKTSGQELVDAACLQLTRTIRRGSKWYKEYGSSFPAWRDSLEHLKPKGTDFSLSELCSQHFTYEKATGPKGRTGISKERSTKSKNRAKLGKILISVVNKLDTKAGLEGKAYGICTALVGAGTFFKPSTRELQSFPDDRIQELGHAVAEKLIEDEIPLALQQIVPKDILDPAEAAVAKDLSYCESRRKLGLTAPRPESMPSA